MLVEAEVKVRILEEDPILTRLSKLQEKGTYEEEDTYFDDPLGILRKMGGTLKLRRRGNEYSIIFKGGDKGGEYKIKEEVEVRISDVNAMERILIKLGFKPRLKIHKVRTEYLLPKGKVFMDRIRGLGTFVEVEALGRSREEAECRLKELVKELKLNHKNLIKESYPRMLLGGK